MLWLAGDLDELRRSVGLTHRLLARRTGRPRSTLNDALTGRRFPRLDMVLAIVRACAGDVARWRDRWVVADRLRSTHAALPTLMGTEAALEQFLALLGIHPDQLARALTVWVGITTRPAECTRQADRLTGASLLSPDA